MQAKTERFEMRLEQETIDEVDAWRGRQSDLPSRAEAVRRLIQAGLAPASSTSKVTLSDGERLTLLMLGEVYKHLKIKGEIDPDFVGSAIYGGHYWGLEWQYSGIFHRHEDSKHVVSEVVDVLDMWSFLESGFANLSPSDKALVKNQAAPFGDNVQFPGFDGNNETEHLGIARFLIGKLDRFSEFASRDLNSHRQSMEAYRRMLGVFTSIRSRLTGRGLNASEIVSILIEKTHPEYRKKVGI